MTELAPGSHDDVEPAPITDLLDFPVEKFWPVLRRFTTPAASAHFIELVLTPPPNTPAPYGQTRFTFTLDFSEPGSAPPEAERLFSLFLPSTEFPTWMLTLSSAPTTLSLSVNLAQSVIVNAYLSPTKQTHRGDDKELMARLGHSSPRAAMIYRHATSDRYQAIAQALGDLGRQARTTYDRQGHRKTGKR